MSVVGLGAAGTGAYGFPVWPAVPDQLCLGMALVFAL